MRTRTKLLHDEHLDLDGNRLHILSEVADDFEVWLNTNMGDFDGLCIGCGFSREKAVVDAVAVLEAALVKLRPLARNDDESSAQAVSGG